MSPKLTCRSRWLRPGWPMAPDGAAVPPESQLARPALKRERPPHGTLSELMRRTELSELMRRTERGLGKFCARDMSEFTWLLCVGSWSAEVSPPGTFIKLSSSQYGSVTSLSRRQSGVNMLWPLGRQHKHPHIVLLYLHGQQALVLPGLRLESPSWGLVWYLILDTGSTRRDQSKQGKVEVT